MDFDEARNINRQLMIRRNAAISAGYTTRDAWELACAEIAGSGEAMKMMADHARQANMDKKKNNMGRPTPKAHDPIGGENDHVATNLTLRAAASGYIPSTKTMCAMFDLSEDQIRNARRTLRNRGWNVEREPETGGWVAKPPKPEEPVVAMPKPRNILMPEPRPQQQYTNEQISMIVAAAVEAAMKALRPPE